MFVYAISGIDPLIFCFFSTAVAWLCANCRFALANRSLILDLYHLRH
jgi:hypothetical protein